MKLSELIVALGCNKNLYASLKDENGKNLATFDINDSEDVEKKYGDKVVEDVKITSHTTAKISLKGDKKTIFNKKGDSENE